MKKLFKFGLTALAAVFALSVTQSVKAQDYQYTLKLNPDVSTIVRYKNEMTTPTWPTYKLTLTETMIDGRGNNTDKDVTIGTATTGKREMTGSNLTGWTVNTNTVNHYITYTVTIGESTTEIPGLAGTINSATAAGSWSPWQACSTALVEHGSLTYHFASYHKAYSSCTRLTGIGRYQCSNVNEGKDADLGQTLNFFCLDLNDVAPAYWKEGTKFGGNKGKKLTLYPDKLGTKFGGAVINQTEYDYRIKDAAGNVVVDWQRNNYKSSIEWTPTTPGFYYIEVTFWRRGEGSARTQWYRSLSDPTLDTLKAELLIVDDFGVSGPVGWDLKAPSSSTLKKTFYHDTMPYIRVNLEGFTLEPGKMWVEVAFYDGNYSATDPGSNKLICADNILSNADLAGWSLNPSKWDESKHTPGKHIAIKLFLKRQIQDEEGNWMVQNAAESEVCYCYMLTGGPNITWLTGNKNLNGASHNFTPQSFYSPGTTNVGLAPNLPGYDYPFGYSHGCASAVFTLKDLKTGTVVETNDFRNIYQGNAYLLQDIPDEYLATAGGHYEARFHLYHVVDGAFVEWDSKYDLVQEFYVMNPPTTNTGINLRTVPCYANNAHDWENFTVFYNQPTYSIEPANTSITDAMIGTAAGQYSAVAVTAHACQFYNKNGNEDRYTTRHTLNSLSDFQSFSWSVDDVPAPKRWCQTADGTGFRNLTAEETKCNYGVYFYLVYHVENNDAGIALKPITSDDINARVFYFDVINADKPSANPVVESDEYPVSAAEAVINYQAVNAKMDGKTGQGHAVLKVGLSKDGGTASWRDPTTATQHKVNGLTLGTYTVYFRFQLYDENCQLGTTEGVNQFTESVTFKVVNNAKMPEVTVTPSKDAQFGTNGWYEPITVTLTLPAAQASADIKYSTDGGSTYTTCRSGASVAINTTTTLKVYAVGTGSYVDGDEVEHTFTINNLDPQITSDLADATVDFGKLFSAGSKEITFNLKHKGLLDAANDGKGTLRFALTGVGLNPTYFALVTPATNTVREDLAGSLTNLPVTVRYTFQPTSKTNHIATLTVTHTSITGATVSYAITLKGESTDCAAPTTLSVTPGVTFATLTIGDGAGNYVYRYAESEADLGSASATEYTITDGSEALLSNLKSGTTYYYKVKRNCGDNVYSDYSSVGTFTTLAPVITLAHPENNELYKGPVSVSFSVSNMNLSAAPGTLPASYLPYGKAKVEFLKGGVVVDDKTVDNIYSANPVSVSGVSLATGNDYKVKITLITETPGGSLVADVVKEQTFRVDLPDVATPTLTIASFIGVPSIVDGTIVYDSAELTIGCTTEGALVEYSLDGGSTWATYDDTKKPHIKSAAPDWANVTVAVKARATKDGMDASGEVSASYTVRPVFNVANARALYAAEYAAYVATGTPTASHRFFRILGDETVVYADYNCHTNSGARRIYVQDKDGKGLSGERSIVLYPAAASTNVSITGLNRGDIIKNVIGQLSKSGPGLYSFIPVNRALEVTAGNPANIWVDTVRAEDLFPYGTKKYHSGLVCIKYEKFPEGGNFTMNSPVTLQCGHTPNHNVNLRPDFYDADYVGQAIPAGDKKYFITGMVMFDNTLSRILPRDGNDIKEAPFVDITHADLSLEGIYGKTAVLSSGQVKYGNGTGTPTLALVKNTHGSFAISAQNLASSPGSFSITYTFQSAYTKDTAWLVARYAEETDTLRIWAESKECLAPNAASTTSLGGQSATLGITGNPNTHYERFDIDKSTVSGSWPAGETLSTTTNTLDITGLQYNTTYYYQVRGVCAVYGEGDEVTSGYITGNFKTNKEAGMSISLTSPAADATINTTDITVDNVHVAYTYSNVSIVDGDNSSSRKGSVRLRFYDYTDNHLGDLLGEKITTAASYDTFLLSGKYQVEAYLLKADGSEFDEDDRATAATSVFTVKLPDAANPVIEVASTPTPIFITVGGVKQYWDSVDVVITCPGETDVTLKYTVNGGEEKTYSAPFRIKATSAIHARSIVNRKDDGQSNADIVILTTGETDFEMRADDALQNREYTTLTWSTALSEAARGDWTVNFGVNNLRADIDLVLRQQADAASAGIKLKQDKIARNPVGDRTGGSIYFEPAVSDLRVGAWHDTILFMYKGAEVNRAVINLTVKAFTIPAVTITPAPHADGHKRSVEVTLAVNDAENTSASYEIHYTTDGSEPTRSLSATCLKYTAPFTLTNDNQDTKDIMVKALAYDMGEVEANRDTTKLENLASATYTLYNDVEINHTHEDIFEATINTNEQLTRTVEHTVKYLNGEVNINVVPCQADGDVIALQVEPANITGFTGSSTAQDINFTVKSVSGLMPGTYQDTIQVTSAGKILCKKVFNLKVTSFRVPDLTISPASNIQYERKVEVTLTMNNTSTNFNTNTSHRAGYYITYTKDGSEPASTADEVTTFSYSAPFTLTNTESASEAITVKAKAWDPTGKDTASALLTATYTLYNNPAITAGPEEVSCTGTYGAPTFSENTLAYTAKYLNAGKRLYFFVEKRATDAKAAIQLAANSVEGEATDFNITFNRVASLDTGSYQDTILIKYGGNTIYKTVVNVRVDYKELPDMDPLLYAGINRDLGHIYEGTKDVDFDVQYRDLYDNKKDRDEKATVIYTLVGADKDYFTLVSPSASETYNFDEGVLHNVPVKIRYTFQGDNLGKHRAGLLVKHNHVIKGLMTDTMWITAESRACPVPTLVGNVVDSVTFATIKLNSDDASKFVMSYATSEADLQMQTSPNKFSETIVDAYTFELSGLKSNTTYYYRIKAYCTENVTSSGFGVKTFTTGQPSIDLVLPGENQVYTSDVEVSFDVDNFHLGAVSAPLPDKYLPYGTATIELLKGDEVIEAATETGNTSGRYTHFLESGNDYKARVTLVTVTPAGDLVPDVVKTQPFRVDLPNVPLPKFTPADGAIVYDSVQLTLNCDSAKATLYYSLNGTDWTQYDPDHKPWIKTPDNKNAYVTVYAKGEQAKCDASDVAEATYEIRPLYKVTSAADLYAYYDGLSTEYTPGFDDKYFQINGNLVVTHTDSSETTKRRIYVQDEGGDVNLGQRSLVIRILSSHDKISVKAFNRGDMLQQGIIGQMVRNQNFLRFLPVNEPIGIQSPGNYIHIDTLDLATIKADKTKFHGDLACVTYVKFNDESDELKEKFTYDQFYTMTCRHGVDMRLRTDFKHANYIGMDRPDESKRYFITGILTQAVDRGVDRARITPRDKNDIVEAPYLDITTANTNLGVVYANTAKVDAALKYGNYEGEPVLTLVKSTRGFTLGTATMADGAGNFTVTYEYQSEEPGMDTAWVVAKYAYGDITDTLKVWAESRLCPKVATVNVSGVSQHEATFDFSGSYAGYEVKYKPTAETEWLEAATAEGESSLTLTDLVIGTEYQYQVKGVCANYPAGPVTKVTSVESNDDIFNTEAEGAMGIALKVGKPADNTGDVEIEFTVKNFELANTPSIENGQHGKVRVSIFRYENNEPGDTVVKEFIQDSSYKTVLPTGRYMASVLLVDKNGELFPDGNISAIRSQRAFNVKWPDVDRPEIAIAGDPVYVTISGERKYYDSIEVEITCPDDDADLFYSLDGSEPSIAYTRGTRIKIRKSGLTTIYAKSSAYRKDSGYDTLRVTVVTDPVNFIHTDGDSVYTYTLTTLSWTKGFNHAYDIDVDSLRDNMTMEVRPGGAKPAIRIERTTLPRNRNAFRTSHTINVYADTTPLVGAGKYCDTIVISSQGRELSRIQVNITVNAFTVPKVKITPEEKDHQRKVRVAMELASKPQNTSATYEIHYTLDGSLPTRELVEGKCFKYTDTITLANVLLPTLDTTVKALAFHMVDFNTDTTKDANVTAKTYTLYNPVEIEYEHETEHFDTISVIETYSRLIAHTAKYLTGEVTVRIVKRSSDAAVAVKADKGSFAVEGVETPVNFTLTNVDGITPGEYQDTVQIRSGGKVLCQKVINLKVTSFRVPKVKITPNAGEYEDELTISMSCMPIAHTGAVYEIHYTLDGSEPTFDLNSTCFKYTAPLEYRQVEVGEQDIQVKALAYDMTKVDTTCAVDSLAENNYNLSHRMYPSLKINPRPADSIEEGYPVIIDAEVMNAYLRNQQGTPNTANARVWLDIYDNGELKFNKVLIPLTHAMVEFTQYDVENTMLGGFYAGHTYKFVFSLQHSDGSFWVNKHGNTILDSCTIVMVEPGTLLKDYDFDWIKAPEIVNIHNGYDSLSFKWKIKNNTDNETLPEGLVVLADLYNSDTRMPVVSNEFVMPEDGVYTINAAFLQQLTIEVEEAVVPGNYTLELTLIDMQAGEEEGSMGGYTLYAFATKRFSVINPVYPTMKFVEEPDSLYEEGYPITIDLEVTDAYFLYQAGKARNAAVILEIYEDNKAFHIYEDLYAPAYNIVEMNPYDMADRGVVFRKDHTYKLFFKLCHLDGTQWLGPDNLPIEQTCSFTIVEQGSLPKDYEIAWISAPKIVNIQDGYDELLFTWKVRNNTDSADIPENIVIMANMYNDKDEDGDVLDWQLFNTWMEEDGTGLYTIDIHLLAQEGADIDKMVEGNYTLTLNMLEIRMPDGETDPGEISMPSYNLIGISTKKFKIYDRDPSLVPPVMEFNPQPDTVYEEGTDFVVRVEVSGAYLRNQGFNTANAVVKVDVYEGETRVCGRSDAGISYRFAEFDSYEAGHEDGFEGFKANHNYRIIFTLCHNDGSVWTDDDGNAITDSCTIRIVEPGTLPKAYEVEWLADPEIVDICGGYGELSFKWQLRNNTASAQIPSNITVFTSLYNDKYEDNAFDWLLERDYITAGADGVYVLDSAYLALSSQNVEFDSIQPGRYTLIVRVLEVVPNEDAYLAPDLVLISTAVKSFEVVNSCSGVAPEYVKLPSVKFEPNGGTHYDSVFVKLSHDSASASIYYRLSADAEFNLYTDSLKLTDLTTTVEAFATMDGKLFINSDTTSVMFIVLKSGEENPAIKLPSVSFKPDGGNFNDSVWVELNHVNTEAEIWYRTSEASAFALYTGTFKLTDTATVEAFSHVESELFINSDTVGVVFNVADTYVAPEPEKVKLPSVKFVPDGGNFNDSVWVSLRCDSAAAQIYYRTASGTAFTLYTASFKLTDTATVEAFAHMDGALFINSDTIGVLFNVADTYVAPEPEKVKLPSVKFAPNGGNFKDSVWVTLSCDSTSAKIYYRTSDEEEFELYTDAFKLIDTATVEAFAYMEGEAFINSDTTAALFNVAEEKIILDNGDPSMDIKIYPNPNNGTFNVLLSKTKKADVDIFSLGGFMVQSEKNVKGLRTYHIYHSGIYFVRVTYGKESKVKRVVVRY